MTGGGLVNDHKLLGCLQPSHISIHPLLFSEHLVVSSQAIHTQFFNHYLQIHFAVAIKDLWFTFNNTLCMEL